ncbi:MAG: alkaline phosphatase family protein [Thermoanaerobacteraceae bacterium]|nr:alkaline phosphatase family protein [Thermoanaerobacteraceae bacterium]
MNNKVILVMVDGLSYSVSISRMGYMMHLVENKLAWLYLVKTELPTLSRPLYEVIMTGTPSYINGIVNNMIVRCSHEKSIFEIARENGLKTAAAAYYWFSELYNKAPFDCVNDREIYNKDMNIQYGKYYFDDSYPDSHLFIDGEILRRKFNPDFLLIHPMGIDNMGHKFGGNSKEYKLKANEIDNILSMFIDTWLKDGYKIIVTADHGMTENGNHGGTDDDERAVPLWIIGENVDTIQNIEIPQLGIAPTICKMLGLKKSEKMINFIFPGLRL